MQAQRKRVCFVTTTPLIVNFFLLDILAELSKRYEVTLVFNPDRAVSLDRLSSNISIVFAPIERKVSLWKDVKAVYKLQRIFKKGRFDMVHTIAPKAGLLGMLAARLCGVGIRLHTFQGEAWVTRQGLWRVILKHADKLTAWLATHLTVISASERNFLISENVVPGTKAVVLGHGSISGVDTTRFRRNSEWRDMIRKEYGIASKMLVFLYLGRLTRDKGVMDLVQAFIKLHRSNADTALLIVGPDEDILLPDILDLSKNSGVPIFHHGYTDVPEQYINAADVLCLPSYREGFGLVIIEAGAIGIPAVASRIYGITDAIVEGETGLLNTSADIDDLLVKMRMLADDAVQRGRMGMAARARAIGCFKREMVIGAIVEHYAKLFGTNPEDRQST